MILEIAGGILLAITVVFVGTFIISWAWHIFGVTLEYLEDHPVISWMAFIFVASFLYKLLAPIFA